MSGYKDLDVYKRSYAAARAVYKIIKEYPHEERDGMVDQMRRASLSIPMNIAEWYARNDSQKEFKRFLLMAVGSANEMLVLVDFSKDVGYISEETHAKAFAEYDVICRMLSNFIKSIERDNAGKSRQSKI